MEGESDGLRAAVAHAPVATAGAAFTRSAVRRRHGGEIHGADDLLHAERDGGGVRGVRHIRTNAATGGVGADAVRLRFAARARPSPEAVTRSRVALHGELKGDLLVVVAVAAVDLVEIEVRN